MERNSRTRLTTAIIIALVFGSGALVGMAWDRAVDPTATVEAAQPAAVEEGPDSTEAAPERRRRMIDRIDLDDTQRAAIDAIIEGHRGRMDALNGEFRQEYYPRYYAIIDGTRELLMSELTDEQAAAYKDLLNQWDTEHPRYENEELPFRRRD